MLSYRALSFFLFLTLCALTLARPATNAGLVERASPASVEAVFTTLKASTDTIIPQLNALAANGNVTEAEAAPAMNNLVAAFNTASSSLNALGPGLRKRQSDAEVATLVAGIIAGVAGALDPLAPAAGFPVLLTAVDVAINKVLVSLDVVLFGVVTLVAELLVDIDILLTALGISLVGLGLGGLGL